MNQQTNSFGTRGTFRLADGTDAELFRLPVLQDAGIADLDRLPFSIRVLLEATLRKEDGYLVGSDDVRGIAGWSPSGERKELPFMPARVILQDFTGVPAVVDLAALRDAMHDLGGDPSRVNPLVPVDLVIDHSVQVDFSGRFADAGERNLEIEYRRNRERYEFLKWGQGNLRNFRAVPPGRGIVHQVNLEWIASVAHRSEGDALPLYYPDTVVGTDSHTTMINGLGVLGWGVGGIEAEAVMLGQPIYMLTPEVVGFELNGRARPGVTATDLTLRIVQMLREKGVVGKFVEFYGDGVAQMSLPDRATIANMAPEYGATCGFFPVDGVTLDFLRLTGRSDDHVDNVERYYKEQGLFWTPATPVPAFSSTLSLDLADVEPALAGPKRPQDRIDLSAMKSSWDASLTAPVGHSGHGLAEARLDDRAPVRNASGQEFELTHGDIVIAAITSCTNTSNPSVMLAAGLLARNARARGLDVKPWVKPSLGPGSRVVADYYERAGLMDDLEALGFAIVGYGCTTCIGNSGPLDPAIDEAIGSADLVVASVLSGNRNFEGRVHQNVRANFLASPPLVVAYALAGTVNIDLERDPIGQDADGAGVFLRDIWPSEDEIRSTIESAISPEMFRDRYSDATAEPRWDAIEAADSERFPWKEDSTYIRRPPFFEGLGVQVAPIEPIRDARVLLKLGDSVTTDHISPAGAFPVDQPAGLYLRSAGVEKADFNSFGSRRGNHEVMMRGTFANVRIRNQVAPGTEGGFTTHFPTGQVMPVFDAAEKYRADGTPLVVLAGAQYGTGSSRDWAAKGPQLLGVRAVIATCFERIHRSNLVGMGVLPLCFSDGESAETLGFDGTEVFDIPVPDDVVPFQGLEVTATRGDGSQVRFTTVVRLDTPVEVDYYRGGGILHTVLRKLAKT